MIWQFNKHYLHLFFNTVLVRKKNWCKMCNGNNKHIIK